MRHLPLLPAARPSRRQRPHHCAFVDAPFAVRVRFGHWIRETAAAEYGEEWLAGQLEIGRRHSRAGKNQTDGVDATPVVPLRHIALVYPITATLRPFLEAGGDPPEKVEAMQNAWRKSVLLQVALWARPYCAPEDW